ncbi:MAG: tetratricopeptide repeat protein [Myxococcales bacterium]
MINLALALVAALAGFALFYFTHIAHAVGSILPAVVAGIVAYVLLARRTVKQLEVVMASAQKELAGRRIEKALAILESAFPLARWQFLVGSQLHGQIGSLLYVQKKFDEAEPHLRKSFVKMWPARAMLAAQHFRRKEWKEMESVFDAAIRANTGESLLYAVYAYCEDKRGERKHAIEILQKGVSEVKTDERLKTLLTRLQNDKRMKLETYGEQWYQFWLETPPQMQGPGGGFGPRQVRWGRR